GNPTLPDPGNWNSRVLPVASVSPGGSRPFPRARGVSNVADLTWGIQQKNCFKCANVSQSAPGPVREKWANLGRRRPGPVRDSKNHSPLIFTCSSMDIFFTIVSEVLGCHEEKKSGNGPSKKNQPSATAPGFSEKTGSRVAAVACNRGREATRGCACE